MDISANKRRRRRTLNIRFLALQKRLHKEESITTKLLPRKICIKIVTFALCIILQPTTADAMLVCLQSLV